MKSTSLVAEYLSRESLSQTASGLHSPASPPLSHSATQLLSYSETQILRNSDTQQLSHGSPRRSGFTLLELLIVISIIAILAAAIIPNFVGFDAEAKVATTQTNLNTLRTRITLFRAKENRYPESLEELTTATYDDLGVERPYLDQMPTELLSDKGGSGAIENRKFQEGLTGDGGWTYITDRAKVVIDVTEPLPSKWGTYAGQKPSEW